MPPRAKKEAGAKAEKAEKKAKAPAKPRKPRKAKVEPGSVGLTAAETAEGADAGDVVARVEAAGGSVLATYREPLGGHSVVFAALPIDKVAPTPYQRELSKAHADRLAGVIPKVGRFLDPIVAVPADEGEAAFITPNGMHRLTAMKTLGAKTVTALVMPEREVAFRILALNTEKAHNLKDKALEVIRMARAMAADPASGKKKESDLALEFEQGALITLGICYEKNGRFSGGAYMPVVSRCDELRDEPIADTLPEREEIATKILELDEAVNEAVVRLKESGFTSGYLKPLVVSRINPLRWVKADKDAAKPDLEKTLAKMLEGAKKFDPGKVKAADVAAAAWMGGGEEA
jgi:ParB family transcriptional regulator, chromosome partitioning protein